MKRGGFVKKSAVFSDAGAAPGRNTSYVTAMPPGHMHDAHELFFLMAGNMTAVCNAQCVQISAPAVLIFKRYGIHCGSSLDEELYDRFVLPFREEILSSGSPLCEKAGFFRASALTVIPLDEAQRQIMLALTARMNAYAADRAALEHLTLWTLYELADWYAALPHTPFAAGMQRSGYIDGVIQYMAEHFDEAVTLESLAARFFVSRAKLVADFKTATGTTVKSYLAMIRLCSAKAMLDGGSSVAHTAACCGYADEGYFIACFARYFGLTPGQYQRSRQKMP